MSFWQKINNKRKYAEEGVKSLNTWFDLILKGVAVLVIIIGMDLLGFKSYIHSLINKPTLKVEESAKLPTPFVPPAPPTPVALPTTLAPVVPPTPPAPVAPPPPPTLVTPPTTLTPVVPPMPHAPVAPPPPPTLVMPPTKLAPVVSSTPTTPVAPLPPPIPVVSVMPVSNVRIDASIVANSAFASTRTCETALNLLDAYEALYDNDNEPTKVTLGRQKAWDYYAKNCTKRIKPVIKPAPVPARQNYYVPTQPATRPDCPTNLDYHSRVVLGWKSMKYMEVRTSKLACGRILKCIGGNDFIQVKVNRQCMIID